MAISKGSGSKGMSGARKSAPRSMASKSSRPSSSVARRPSSSPSKSISRSSSPVKSVSRPSISKPAASKPSLSRPTAARPVTKGLTKNVSSSTFGSASKGITKSVSSTEHKSIFKHTADVTPKKVISQPQSSKGLFKHNNGIDKIGAGAKSIGSNGLGSKSVGTVGNKNFSNSSFNKATHTSSSYSKPASGSIANKVLGSSGSTGYSTTKSTFKNVAGAAATGYVASTAVKSYRTHQQNPMPVVYNSITSGLDLLNDNYTNGYYAYGYANDPYADFPPAYSNPVLSKEYQESVLLARVAACFYMAYADKQISAEEKNEFDIMITDILNNKKISSKLKKDVKELASTPITSFIQVEKYLQNIEPEDLIPLISLAEDMADADANVSYDESTAIYKIRSYVSDRTGCDFVNKTKDADAESAKYQESVMLAKLAVCCYVAKADGKLSDEDRNEIGTIINKILDNGNAPAELRAEVNSIFNSEDNSFILVENYLQPLEDDDIIPMISLAEEIAYNDQYVETEERNAVNMIRDYITNRSGQDFTSAPIDEGDLICPGCSGQMEVLVGGVIECPYCGTRKTLKKESNE